jgi:hypothetical protein
MYSPDGAQRRRKISAGALLAAGVGMALYQLTNLGLGPGARQLQLSLTIPTVDPEPALEPGATNVTLIVGSQPAPPAASLNTASRLPTNRSAAYPAASVAPVSKLPTPPAATPKPTPRTDRQRHPLPPDEDRQTI